MGGVHVQNTGVPRVGFGVPLDGLEDVPATMAPFHVSRRSP